MPRFDPLEPFASKSMFGELIGELRAFEFKLYRRIPLKFYRGKKSKLEFDLNLGVIHFTEEDFMGLSEIFKRINKKWGTDITYCIYPAKDTRSIIMNVRSPKAPSEID